MKETVEKMLEDMRKITMLTGEISSIHMENLKKWPYVAFNSVIENIEIEYDLTKQKTQDLGEGSIVFNISNQSSSCEDFKNQDSFNTRCEIITSWVRDMFWPEIKVEIFFNSKKVYSNSYLEKKVANGLK